MKVTEVEGDALAARAAELAVSVPRLLVESALAPVGEMASERRAAMVELFAARRLLAAVSNNVNQVAKATNATREVQADLVATLAAVRSVVFRIDECLEAVGGRGKVGRR